MANFNPGGNPVILQNLRDPTTDDEAATKRYVDDNSGGTDNITASGGLQRVADDISIVDDGVTTAKISPQAVTSEEIADGTIVEGDIAEGAITTNRLADDAVSSAKIADIAVKEEHLDITNSPTAGQVLTSATDTTQFTWVDPGIDDIVDGGHIDVSIVDGVATLTFDEKYDLWNGKSDWSLITTGTPTGDNILWNAVTETLSVPSLAGREILEILLDARSGMAVHIRQENTTSEPTGFQSGFYQILSINATDNPSDLVTLRLLPDASDIFNETAGNTYTYELSILQFVTGGTLDNLTLHGLADTDLSTPPTDTQVLAYDSTNNVWHPRDAETPDLASSEIGDLGDVSGTYRQLVDRVLSYIVPEGEVAGYMDAS